MEIVNANVASLSNFEVMLHLQKIKDPIKKQTGPLATIVYETSRYLESSPAGKLTSESLVECVKELKPFKLKKNEIIMILNNPPTTALEIQLVVEESEERLSEEQVDQILKICADRLGAVPRVEVKEEDDG